MGLWLFIILLLSVEVFNLNFVSYFLGANACFGYILVILFFLFTFYIRIPVWDIKDCMWPVVWIMIGTALSYIPANFYYGQYYTRSFLTNRHMLMIWMVPILYATRPTLKELRQAFYAFTIVYLIMSIMVTFVDQNIIPHSDSQPFIEEGDFIHILPGIRLLVIALILAMNECRKQLSVRNLLWAFFIFGVVFLVQNRTSLLTAIIIIFMGIRMSNNAKSRLVGTAIGIFLAIIMALYTATQWNYLIEQTIEELSDPEYNRNKAYTYMFAPRDLMRYILGDGFISTYSHPLMSRLQENGIFFSDVGMFGFWNQYGVVSSAVLMILFIRGCTRKYGYIVNALSVFFLIGIPSLSYFGMYSTLVPLSIFIYLFYVMADNPDFDTMPEKVTYDVHGRKVYYRSISSA